MQPVTVLAVLYLTQRLWLLFFCCIMRCRCLHGVAVLKSNVFHKHVSVSGIVLMNNSSLSPMQPSVQRFDVLRRSITDDLRFDGINTCHFPLELHQFLCRPCEHEIVTVCQARYSIFFVMQQILRTESELESPVPDVLLPITLPIAGRIPLFRTCSSSSIPLFQRRCPFCPPLVAVSARVSGPFHGKYARDTSMFMIEKVWFLCGLLRSILWPSTPPMEESLHSDLADRHF